jgi:hypothetical protein
MLRVMSKGECSIKQINEAIWPGGKCPLEKFIIDAQPAWSGLV